MQRALNTEEIETDQRQQTTENEIERRKVGETDAEREREDRNG